MFITHDTQKSLSSALFLGDGETGWSAAELLLQRPWFLVQSEKFDAPTDPEFSNCRTVLLFDFQSVEQFIQSGHDSQVRLKSVHIVTPAHVNGGDTWQMDQLRTVWQGSVLNGGYGVPIDIFETVSGDKYSASFLDPSTERLDPGTLKFEFACLPELSRPAVPGS